MCKKSLILTRIVKKNYTYIFYHFSRAKMVQKYHKTTKKHVWIIFRFFTKVLDTTEVQTASGSSVNNKKMKEQTKFSNKWPRPKVFDGSGSSNSLRGVGLIQIFQDLDLRVQINRHIVNSSRHTGTNVSQPYTSSSSRSSGEEEGRDGLGSEPDWFRWTGPVRSLIKTMSRFFSFISTDSFSFFSSSSSRSLFLPT
jgi:hypothetical protein